MNAALALVYLLTASLAVVAFVNARGPRLFSFPFLFSAVWIAFVLVGFAEFIRFSGDLYRVYDELGVIDTALFMLITCALGGLIGYQCAGGGRAPKKIQAQERVPLRKRKMQYMHRASFVLAGMSYSAFVMLAGLGGGLQSYILHSGAYSIDWEGLPVYLMFVVRFGYVAIVIQLWLWSVTGRRSHLLWALAFSVVPLINIFFIFRRSEVVKVGVYFGYFIANYTRMYIGRVHAICALATMYVIFRLFPLLRSEENKSLGVEALLGSALSDRISYESSEIGAGLFRIYQSMEQGTYEYGAIFYNSIIKQFVPGTIVGPDLKNSLLLPTIQNADTYFANFLFYVSPMGFAQAFQQFWLFGSIIFFVLGWMIARLEQRRFKGPRHEILLVLLIPEVLATVSADLSIIVARVVTYTALVVLCIPRAKRSLRPQ